MGKGYDSMQREWKAAVQVHCFLAQSHCEWLVWLFSSSIPTYPSLFGTITANGMLELAIMDVILRVLSLHCLFALPHFGRGLSG